jgi:hypothetical protein
MIMKLAAFATVLALHAVAAADPNSAKAEALFRQGRDLVAAGKLGEACSAFDASQRLGPATTTLFNQADCREKNDQLATAWGLFVDAERQTRSATDAVGSRMHGVAVERAANLATRVSMLTVRIAKQVPGLVVLRGGEVVDPGEYGRALPIDGGTYVFTARVGDRDVWSEKLTILAEHDARTVDVVPRMTDAAPAQPELPATSASGPVEASPSRLGAALTTVGAGVLLGSALAFDLVGDNTYAQAKADHDMGKWNAANDDRYTAEGLLVAGVGCTAVAIYLWLEHHDERPARVAHSPTIVAPVARSGYAGLELDGRW